MTSHVRSALWTLITFNFFIHFKKENFLSPSVFLSPLPLCSKYIKKVVKFLFTQQEIFWVLVFSIRIWYLAYPTDRSYISAWNNYIK